MQLPGTVKKTGTFQKTTHMLICLRIFLWKELHGDIIQRSMKACMVLSKIHTSYGQIFMNLQNRYLLWILIGKCANFLFFNRFFVQIIGSMFPDTLKPWLHLWRSSNQRPILQVQKNQNLNQTLWILLLAPPTNKSQRHLATFTLVLHKNYPIESVEKSFPQFKLKKLLDFFKTELPLLNHKISMNRLLHKPRYDYFFFTF